MFTKRIPLFTLYGFKVGLDLSWLVLAVLVSWSLAAGLFPALYPGLSSAAYWAMGVAGLIGLFFSIVAHEFAHSVVARHYDMPIRGITLFIFGGIAEMNAEPTSAKAEFYMALVGPVASLVLAAAFYMAAAGSGAAQAPVAVAGTLSYLGLINLVLAVFNMVPAFPLDGGRILRAALWGWKGQYLWATRVAARFGSVFAFLLMGLAVLSVLSGNFIGGMWWFLIGLFLRSAAEGGYQQALVRQALRDRKVSSFMTSDPVTVAPDLSVDALVEEFFYRHYFKRFPVVEKGRLVGCVDLGDVKQIPRETWKDSRVSAIMRACGDDNTVDPDTSAADVLGIMRQTGAARLLVARADRLYGIVSQSDIMRFLAIRLDLASEQDLAADRPRPAGGARLAHEAG